MKRTHIILVVLLAVVLIVVVVIVLASRPANTPGTAAPTWQSQYDLGVRYLSQGNYQEAIIAFRAAIEINPRRADAYIGLAEAYIALGDIDAAIAALQEGLLAIPDNERLQSMLDDLIAQDGSGSSESAGPAQGNETPGPSDNEDLPPLIPVLIRQEVFRTGGILVGHSTYEYDEMGYIKREEHFRDHSSYWHGETPDHFVFTHEYDEASDMTSVLRDGEFEYQKPGRIMGTRSFSSQQLNILKNPYPEVYSGSNFWMIADFPLGSSAPRPQTVENFDRRPDPDEYERSWESWGLTFPVRAEYEYDENNNAVFIRTIDRYGNETGYAILHWALLVLQPDGTYIMDNR